MRYRNTWNPLDIRFSRIKGLRERRRSKRDPKSYLPGHIFTEAIPDKASEEPSNESLTLPSVQEFDRTANSQRESALLRLPIEVRRQIYDAVWEAAGLTRHIYIKDGRYAHMTCITDHDGPDERQVELWKIFKIRSTFLEDPVWSRRLLSSWVNHWRCEETAVATQGSQAPTPFLALLLCCKRMYVDCRKRLYERLTFIFHRAETALDFLTIQKSAIVTEIRSLQLSIQVSATNRPEGWDDMPPELPWHCTANTWISLRDSLAEPGNLRHLSIWLDACSQQGREYLMLDYYDLFIFDPRIAPILRLSKPIDDYWWDYYLSYRPVKPYLVGRGMSELWQEPTIAPHITFSRRYGNQPLYQEGRHGGVVGGYPHWTIRGCMYNARDDIFKWGSKILRT